MGYVVGGVVVHGLQEFNDAIAENHPSGLDRYWDEHQEYRLARV